MLCLNFFLNHQVEGYLNPIDHWRYSLHQHMDRSTQSIASAGHGVRLRWTWNSWTDSSLILSNFLYIRTLHVEHHSTSSTEAHICLLTWRGRHPCVLSSSSCYRHQQQQSGLRDQWRRRLGERHWRMALAGLHRWGKLLVLEFVVRC